MRIAELGLVHRYEASGVMHGLVRVRQFTQDDAHIFCTPEMIEPEVIGVINLVFELYKAFGFEQFTIELSTKPEKHIGSDEIWDVATNALKNLIQLRGRIKVNSPPAKGSRMLARIGSVMQSLLLLHVREVEDE